MADLCPEPCIEFTESEHYLEPCLSEESRPAIEDDECDDAADAKSSCKNQKGAVLLNEFEFIVEAH